jgi:hypothetical protein
VKPPTYPFRPQSTAYLEAGQFWSVVLPDGQFACGRVLGPAGGTHKGSTRLFRAGLLDWLGDGPPSSEAIAGRGVLAEGLLHVKSIEECGGEILGWRSLQADGIDAGEHDDTVPTWGYTVPRALAAARLLGRTEAESTQAAG